jgi:hypothetical protein
MGGMAAQGQAAGRLGAASEAFAIVCVISIKGHKILININIYSMEIVGIVNVEIEFMMFRNFNVISVD